MIDESMDLNEARKNLEACLGEELRKEYFAILRQWFRFKSPITKKEFDTEVRKLLVTEEQVRCHNHFLLALLSKRSISKGKTSRNTSDKGLFECADYTDYIQPSSPTMLPPIEYERRCAGSELFMPDTSFVATRIAVTTWENGLDGAQDDVTEVIIHACQTFVRNIIVAMISKKKGYRVRDRKFQYGFNLPVPDPFLRNTSNLVDEAQESKVQVSQADDAFVPKSRPSMEFAKQQAGFAYACAKEQSYDNLLTVRLLYNTLRERPQILGLHEMHSVNMLKLGLQLD